MEPHCQVRSQSRAPSPAPLAVLEARALGVEGPGDWLPLIPRRASQRLSLAHLRYAFNVPSMPGLLEVPSVLSAGNHRGWRSFVQTAGGELSRLAVGWGAGQPCRVCEVVFRTPQALLCPSSPRVSLARPLPPPPPPPSTPRVSRSFKLFETLIGGPGAGLRDSRLLKSSHHVTRPNRGLEGEPKGSPNFFFPSQATGGSVLIGQDSSRRACQSRGPRALRGRTEPQPSRI